MSHRNINTQIERNNECLKKNQINLRKILTKRRFKCGSKSKVFEAKVFTADFRSRARLKCVFRRDERRAAENEEQKIASDLERLEVGWAAGQSTKTGFVKFENPSRAQPAAPAISDDLGFRRRNRKRTEKSRDSEKQPNPPKNGRIFPEFGELVLRARPPATSLLPNRKVQILESAQLVILRKYGIPEFQTIREFLEFLKCNCRF